VRRSVWIIFEFQHENGIDERKWDSGSGGSYFRTVAAFYFSLSPRIGPIELMLEEFGELYGQKDEKQL